ncbi:MAG: hypothetical protein RI580_00575 [Halothece sp. Uz-M2-17]|nr:hypothetical protein [Halothece sp. Uz-M2-17]
MSIRGFSSFSHLNFKSILTILLVIGCVGTIIKLQQDTFKQLTSEKTKSRYEQQEQQMDVNLSLLSKVPSFGFENLLADWVYLRFIQYMGDEEARNITGYSLNPKYLQAVAERDPYFLSAYFLLSSATTLYAGAPEKSVQTLEQLIKEIPPEHFPRSYYLWLYKGVDEMLFLGDISAAIHSYDMAAEWASLHDTEEAQYRAQSARKTAQFLKENPLSKEARIGAWGSILSNAQDQKTRELVIQKIRNLGGEVIINSKGRLEIQLPDPIKKNS